MVMVVKGVFHCFPLSVLFHEKRSQIWSWFQLLLEGYRKTAGGAL